MQQKSTMRPNNQTLEPFIFLYITEECQLRCKHCYMGERLEQERYMSTGLVEEFLRAMRILYGHYKVYLLGGEPLLHPELQSIIKICKQEGYAVVITSNGLFPSKQWQMLSKDQIDSFSFSLDGASKEAHEFQRGGNTYRPLIENIRHSVDLGFQTRLIYTVTKRNIDEVDNAISLAEDLGVNQLSFHYFTPTGLGRRNPELQILPDEWMEFCSWLRSRPIRGNLNVYYPPAFVKEDQVISITRAGYRGCTARNLERLAFFPDRRVYICSAFFDTDLHYGEFHDGRIIPRVDSNGINELTLVNRLSGNCTLCPNNYACRGGCAAYDYFGHTVISDNCDQKTLPICPLWSCSVTTEAPLSIQELR